MIEKVTQNGLHALLFSPAHQGFPKTVETDKPLMICQRVILKYIIASKLFVWKIIFNFKFSF